MVRLAESGTTKNLHLPKEIVNVLTPETRQTLDAAGMSIVPIPNWY